MLAGVQSAITDGILLVVTGVAVAYIHPSIVKVVVLVAIADDVDVA